MKNKYTFSGDSGSTTIEASSPDAAARQYDSKASSMDHLMRKIASVGGYITITENGLVIERISQDGERL
jgi:hypothetical protein